MSIKFLGTRGEIEKKAKSHSKHSGVLIDEILLDLGEKEFLDYRFTAVLLTHLHSDHAFFMKKGLKVDEKEFENVKTLTFYSPEIPENVPRKNWHKVSPLKTFKIKGIRITPIPTIHSKIVRSTSYLLELRNKRILYTGDLIWIKKKYHEYLKDLDLVITDGSFLKEGGMIRRDKETGEIYGHTGMPNLIKLFKRLGAKKIVFTHLGTKGVELGDKELKKRLKSIDSEIEIEVARDGFEMSIEDLQITTEEIKPLIPKRIISIKPKTALYLVSPHAKKIFTREKTLIVKTKRFTKHIGEPLYVIEDSLAYGIIKLKEPREISPEEFKKLRNRHLITNEEVKKWGWNEKGPFYAYEFEILKEFDPPKIVKVPKGVQVFVSSKLLKWKELNELTLLELTGFLKTDNNELFIETFLEAIHRGIKQSDLVNLIKGSLEEYEPSKQNDRQLGDDWRLVLAYYSRLRRGKKVFKHVKGERVPVTIEDIKRVAFKIFKEMNKRGFSFNHPRTYKKYAKELFIWSIKKIGGIEKVTWKEGQKPERLNEIPDYGLIMKREHIEEIFSGKKKAIVRTVKMPLQSPYYLIADNKIHGVVVFKDVKEISLEEFKKLSPLHLITEEDREEWSKSNPKWKSGPFFLYTFQAITKWENPKSVKYPEGRTVVSRKQIEVLSLIPKGNLEEITPEYLKSLSDEDLKTLDKELHDIFKETRKITEPLHNAHVFILEEFRRRGLRHSIDDDLFRETIFEVEEYPALSEEITLNEVLEAMPGEFTIKTGEPTIFLTGRIVNKGRIVKPSSDIDILVKQPFDRRIIHTLIYEVWKRNPKVAKKLHFNFTPIGPSIGYYIPLYRTSFKKERAIVIKAPQLLSDFEPFTPFVPLKQRDGFNKFEFFDKNELYKIWVAPRLKNGIVLEPKFDGRRFSFHYKDGKVKIITEDRMRDRASVFPSVIEEFKKEIAPKIKSVIFDLEAVAYDCKGKTVKNNKPRLCDYISREETGWMTVGKGNPEQEKDTVFHVHDILYLNGKSLGNLPYLERVKIIKSLIPKNLSHWEPTAYWVADNPKEFWKAFENALNYPYSEGAMLKEADSKYPFKKTGTNRTPEWAKYKKTFELDVMVYSHVEKRDSKTGKGLGMYMYYAGFRIPCEMATKFPELKVTKNEYGEEIPNPGGVFKYKGKCYSIIGRTYATKEKNKRGDIISVRTVRLRKFERNGKKWITWMFPIYIGKRPEKDDADTITTVERILEKSEKERLSELALEHCPYYKSQMVCPVVKNFIPLSELSNKELKFPIACLLASIFRCRWVKPYYYEGEKSEDNS